MVVRLLSGAALAILCASCVDATVAAPSARAPVQGLQPYMGQAMALFDDDIEPQALGYKFGGGPRPEDAALLRERTRLGDRVIRARVVTVTSSDVGNAPILRIGLHALEDLAGSRVSGPDLTLDVAGSARGAATLKQSQSHLVGLSLIAFVRSFAGEGDEAQVHFHLAQDDKFEAAAVRVASIAVETH